MPIPGLDPLEALCREVNPSHAFRGKTFAEFQRWRDELLPMLRRLSGLERMAERWNVPLECELVSEEERDGFTLEQRLLLTAPDYWMPFCVLRASGPGPFAPVIALQGHSGTREDLVGAPRDEAGRERIKRVNYDYGLQAAQQGFIAFAPDKRGFGERTIKATEGDAKSCVFLAKTAMLLGMSVIGIHTWDNQRLLDYIATREDCREGPAGCCGVSGGGGGTMWLAAMDERIGAAVISCHLGVFRNGWFGCVCNAAPGLLAVARRADVAGLTAPRPLLIESGSGDRLYTRERTLKAYGQLEEIYAAAGAPDNLDIDLFEGGHEWSGRKAWDWFARWLS